jgi:hypothetical protein
MTGSDYILAKKQVESVGYARTSVETAKRIQNTFEGCDSDLAALDQIKAGVAEYERKIPGT